MDTVESNILFWHCHVDMMLFHLGSFIATYMQLYTLSLLHYLLQLVFYSSYLHVIFIVINVDGGNWSDQKNQMSNF